MKWQHAYQHKGLQTLAVLLLFGASWLILFLHFPSLPLLRVYRNNNVTQNETEHQSLLVSSDVTTHLDKPNAQTHRSARIAKVMMLFGPPKPVYERASRLQSAHNAFFGYPMFVSREKMLPGLWSKLAYMQGLMIRELSKPADTRLHWLFCIDADVVIMNPKIPLEVFLPPDTPDGRWNEVKLLVNHDHNGLNNGAYFIRVDPWSIWFMSDALAMTHYWPDVQLKHTDQTAMGVLIEIFPEYRQFTIRMPQRWFNAFTGYRRRGVLQPPVKYKANSVTEGDLLCHFAGDRKHRTSRMTEWLDIAEQHLSQWKLELNQTSIVEEVQRFWADEAGKQQDEARQVAVKGYWATAGSKYEKDKNKLNEEEQALYRLNQHKAAAVKKVKEAEAKKADEERVEVESS